MSKPKPKLYGVNKVGMLIRLERPKGIIIPGDRLYRDENWIVHKCPSKNRTFVGIALESQK